MSKKPLVAIVGRPNVGKSTLFNCLSVDEKALVEETAGVTRDWRESNAQLGDLDFLLTDSAGLEDGVSELSARMNVLTHKTLVAADVILFMLDGRDGILPMEEAFANELRRLNKPVIVVVNKADVAVAEDTLYAAPALGFESVVAVSAAHQRGLGDLEEILETYITPLADTQEEPDQPLKLAIVGQPNAGKSTLVNALLNDERMLTGPQAGLTRESVGSLWEVDGDLIELVDTPGIRKKARIAEKLEKMSVTDAFAAIEKADAVILMLDATTWYEGEHKGGPFEVQDQILADKVVQQGKPLLIALNKWDAVTSKDACLEHLHWQLAKGLAQLKEPPVQPLSALNGKHVEKLLPQIKELRARSETRVSTAKLNHLLDELVSINPPPVKKGRRLKLKYMTQTNTCPPTFVLWCNMPKALPTSYRRFVVNRLREVFDLHGIPVRLFARTSENPYAK